MKKDQSKRAAAAAFMGTTIEFYDFYVYATAAALILGTVFSKNRSSDRNLGIVCNLGCWLYCQTYGRFDFWSLG